MTRSTADLRSIYAPACAAHKRIGFLDAYRALDAVMRKWRYAPKSGQTGSYNCRHITGGSGYSLHAYRADFQFKLWTGVVVTVAVAVDINWQTNPYGKVLHTDMPRGMVEEILAIRTNGGAQVWRWGGYYKGNKDAMHYEIVASPAELASGIRGLGTGTPPKEEDEVRVVRDPKTKRVYAVVEHFGRVFVDGNKGLTAMSIKRADIKTVAATDPALKLPIIGRAG